MDHFQELTQYYRMNHKKWENLGRKMYQISLRKPMTENASFKHRNPKKYNESCL